MSFKNLRNPAENANPRPQEEKREGFPEIDDMGVNGDRDNATAISEAEQEWGPPKMLPETGPRLPMKLK